MEETQLLHLVESLAQRVGDTRAGALARDGLAGLMALAICCGPAYSATRRLRRRTRPARWGGVRADVPLLLHGIAPEGFKATVTEVGERLGGHEAGVAIDPQLFGIERVPSVVVPGGVAGVVYTSSANRYKPRSTKTGDHPACHA